jgi:hypothetical protein
MFSVELAAAPVLKFGIGLLVNVQVALVGTPELHDSDTEFGMIPVGVTVML